MSWMEKLYQTYEAGVLLDLPQAELPMPTSHTLQNAHINIVIDGEGNFKRASVLEKTQIVLPATESSASRSSGEAAHPLADKLQYVAQDYLFFGGQKSAYFAGYQKQLKAWCESAHAHTKVQAVCCYINKGTVIADLLSSHILFVDIDHKLLIKWVSELEVPPLFKVLPKEKGMIDQGSALVCWTVEMPSDPMADTWKDASIQKSWVAYDTAESGNIGLCFVTGKPQTLSTNHPAKLRHTGDKAKLISSNDSSGYTYRGKFLDDVQASAVGFDVSQKAHNALRWLISRQGFRNGDQVYVAWAVSGKPTPEPLRDAWSFLSTDDVNLEAVNSDSTGGDAEEPDHTRDLGQSYAMKLKKYMAGYALRLKPNEQILVMGLDSATPGRMGIVYYRELMRDDFFNRLEAWHREFAWQQRHTKDVPSISGKKPKTEVIWPISSPVPKAIALAAYGEKVSDELKKKVIERVIPCIIDGQPFPFDLVTNCVRRAINRNAYATDERWQWERNLGIACALYKGFYQRHPKKDERKEYSMALDEKSCSRDYLFGRLLAVAERIEEIALLIAKENRSTNAARLMQRFADHPLETWRAIELALQPYVQRLRVPRTGFLVNSLKEIDAISALFVGDDFIRKGPLSGEFLLAYHCQRQKFREKNEVIEDTTQLGEPT